MLIKPPATQGTRAVFHWENFATKTIIMHRMQSIYMQSYSEICFWPRFTGKISYAAEEGIMASL
jgi:hypothetical protein